MSEEPVKV